MMNSPCWNFYFAHKPNIARMYCVCVLKRTAFAINIWAMLKFLAHKEFKDSTFIQIFEILSQWGNSGFTFLAQSVSGWNYAGFCVDLTVTVKFLTWPKIFSQRLYIQSSKNVCECVLTFCGWNCYLLLLKYSNLLSHFMSNSCAFSVTLISSGGYCLYQCIKLCKL